MKLKEQLQKTNNEIENLKEERENLRKLMNEAINKCSILMKEKSEIEKDLIKKNLQVENLKNTNMLLHKNVVTGNEKYISSDEKNIKYDGKDENTMINLIRREKEKNKVFLEEIKKLKK